MLAQGVAAAAGLCLDEGDEALCRLLVGVAVVVGVEVILRGLLDLFVVRVRGEVLDLGLHVVADLLLAEVHAETVLCVILEEAVCPCGAAAFLC